MNRRALAFVASAAASIAAGLALMSPASAEVASGPYPPPAVTCAPGAPPRCLPGPRPSVTRAPRPTTSVSRWAPPGMGRGDGRSLPTTGTPAALWLFGALMVALGLVAVAADWRLIRRQRRGA